MTTIISAATILLAVLLNIIASIRVATSLMYTSSQKRMQLVLVWAVPVAGATLALAVIRADRTPLRSRGLEGPQPLGGSSNSSFGDSWGGGHHGDGGHGGDGDGGGH